MVGTPEGSQRHVTRTLVVGSSGMLGRDLLGVLGEASAVGLSRKDLDITDASAAITACEGFDVVVNCAAYTAVDEAESHKESAFAVNHTGARNLARAAHQSGVTLIQISTDYVFDGTSTTPYRVDAPTNPLSVYGASKLAGEHAVFEENPDSSIIVRTSWLYGQHGTSFPRSILTAGRDREYLEVVDDQVGQPTWTRDVANMLEQLIGAKVHSGIFHATNEGRASWFEFAQKLFDLAGWDPGRVRPTKTALFPRPAPRPAWSVLDHSEWKDHGLQSPRSWDVALNDAWQSGLSAFASPESKS